MWDFNNYLVPHVFCKSIFLKRVKGVCFDRLLQVLIPKDLGAGGKWIPKRTLRKRRGARG